MTFISIIIICIDDILCIVGDVPQDPSIIAGINVTEDVDERGLGEEVDGRGLREEGFIAFVIVSSETLLRDNQGIFAIAVEGMEIGKTGEEAKKNITSGAVKL